MCPPSVGLTREPLYLLSTREMGCTEIINLHHTLCRVLKKIEGKWRAMASIFIDWSSSSPGAFLSLPCRLCGTTHIHAPCTHISYGTLTGVPQGEYLRCTPYFCGKYTRHILIFTASQNGP